jgi:hypothetical protein
MIVTDCVAPSQFAAALRLHARQQLAVPQSIMVTWERCGGGNTARCGRQGASHTIAACCCCAVLMFWLPASSDRRASPAGKRSRDQTMTFARV